MKKIAIQGIKGCFHHVSLIKFLWINYYEIVECKNFNQLTQVIINKESNLGLIAIENSIFGSILSNYIFLFNHNFKILSSIVLYIEHHLIAFLDKEFNEILSHKIALKQCDNFISEYTNLRTIEYNDTALASLYIYKYMFRKKAAIASKLASKEYNLKIINKNIQSISNNFTKFFLIEQLQKKIKKNWNKSSILFCLNTNYYKKFLRLLSLIANKKILITKILPFIKNKYEYIFYIDFILNDYINYEYIKSKIKYQSYTYSILGEYINFLFI